MYRKTNIIIIVIISIFVLRCNNDELCNQEVTISDDTIINKIISIDTIIQSDVTDFEKILISAGLVNIKDLDTSIFVDIRYSTINNFLKIDMYGDFDKAYFQKEVAEKISQAQVLLKQKEPNYSLIIFDGARPRTIQKLMWDSIKVPEDQKFKYLANPKHISMHSYGLAVDLSIVDGDGKLIDMGTKYDSFEELAYPVLEDRMLKNGLLKEKQYQNRLLLRNIMEEVGFNSISTEWWHFSIYDQKTAAQLFTAIESHILAEDTTIYIAEVKTEVERDKGKVESVNITFKIQLKTSMKAIDVNDKVFKDLPIFRYFHDGMYKYTTGSFKDLASAYEHRDKIKAMGFSDCFVAGFNNDERIGIKDAVELAN